MSDSSIVINTPIGGVKLKRRCIILSPCRGMVLSIPVKKFWFITLKKKTIYIHPNDDGTVQVTQLG